MPRKRKDWDLRVPVKTRRMRELVAPYDDRLPSMPPFMWVERHERMGDLGVLAYGAYNAMGLIGPEEGGVAVVFEHPERSVLATKAFAYDPLARDTEADRIIRIMRGLGSLSPVRCEALEELVRELEASGYSVRR